MHAHVIAMYRYPVKGLAGAPLRETLLRQGQGLDGDRRFAIARSDGSMERGGFLGITRHARLATLTADFDKDEAVLTISRKGRAVARGDVTAPAGRATIEQFLSAYLAKELNGPARLMDAAAGAQTLGATGTDGGAAYAEASSLAFADPAHSHVHLINLASVRDLERVIGATVDPRRFRANIWLDGIPAWSELGQVGETIRIGGALLQVIERTERCAATNVNPDTAERDLNIPLALRRGFGHLDFGVYATVVEGGTVAVEAG